MGNKRKRKSKMTDEEYAKHVLQIAKHIISNSFYGMYGVELFNRWNKPVKQENLPVKTLETNEIYKKE